MNQWLHLYLGSCIPRALQVLRAGKRGDLVSVSYGWVQQHGSVFNEPLLCVSVPYDTGTTSLNPCSQGAYSLVRETHKEMGDFNIV